MKRLFYTICFIASIGGILYACSSKTGSKENDNTPSLGSKKTKDLFYLGKVWGFLKYYHPAVASGKLDWDLALVKMVPKIMKCESSDERNELLLNWVEELGETKDGKPENVAADSIKMKPDLEWLKSPDLGKKLSARLLKVQIAERDGKNYHVKLYLGIGCADFPNEKLYHQMKYPNFSYRMLSLFRYWNFIEYFFPYKYLMDISWNKTLNDFIPVFADAQNSLEYNQAVMGLFKRVNDTHAAFSSNDPDTKAWQGNRLIVAQLSYVENHFIVSQVYEHAENGLKQGDLILKVNGRDVNIIAKEKANYISASNPDVLYRDIASALCRMNDTVAVLEIDRDGKKQELRVPTVGTFFYYPAGHIVDTAFKMIGNDIAYLNTNQVKLKSLDRIMGRSMLSKGFVLDVRGYPTDFTREAIARYFLSEEKTFTSITIPSTITPGLFVFKEKMTTGKPNKNAYKGKVVILVNEETQSASEFNSMIFRTIPGSVVMGSTTAGADGDCAKIDLPGGISTVMTGIGIYYPDGSETQRVGIVPDIVAKPTIKGIRAGKEEVLDRAVEYLRTGK